MWISLSSLYVVPRQDDESLIVFAPLRCRSYDNFADLEEEATAVVRHIEKKYTHKFSKKHRVRG